MEFVKKEPKIYVLSGKARSGKNYIADLIKDYYQDQKCIDISYAYYLKDYAKRIIGWDGSEATKPREFLQQLGIELIKNRISKTLLIDRIEQDIEVFSYFYDVIIITDARLPEELEMPKKHFKQVVTIRVDRPYSGNELTEEQQAHLTETALDHYTNYDYIFENDGDIDCLKKKLEVILKSEA